MLTNWFLDSLDQGKTQRHQEDIRTESLYSPVMLNTF